MTIDHPIALATDSPDATPFALTSRHCRVSGTQAGDSLIVDANETVQTKRMADAQCTRFRVSPLGVERTFRTADGEITETIVVAPDAPVAVIDWRGAHTERQIYGATSHDVDPEAWIRTHNAAAQRREREQLCIATDDVRVARAFEWAKYRLASAGRALPLHMPDSWERLPALESWVSECEEEELGAWRDGADTVVRSVVRMLGYAPDAERERLQLAPHLPDDVKRFAADNIAVGSALVSLEYERSATGRTFKIVQNAGPYPIRLIFEPVLPNQRFHPFVDGTPALLDVMPIGDCIVLPVQIMLDEQRVIELRDA